MKYLFLLLLLSTYTYGATKHPIFNQIIKNSPKIDRKYAMKLSNIIYKMRIKYHIPSRIFTAILRQESNYSLKAKGCHGGMRELTGSEKLTIDIKCSAWEKKYINNIEWSVSPERYNRVCVANRYPKIETKVCNDFGISQINYRTARRFDIDIDRLTNDLEYSVEAGAIVLSEFMKRYEARDNEWYLRYNCGSRSTTKRDTCQIYKKLISRYL